MLPDRKLKFILDRESVISEIAFVKQRFSSFHDFQNDRLATRAVERQLEIIGEAVNNLLKIDPEIGISNARKMVGLRNLIIHSYDSVDVAILWGIIQKDIPVLENEIASLKG